MQEIVRRCDMPIGKKGNQCGERVPDDIPTRMLNLSAEPQEADLCVRHREKYEEAIAPFLAIAKPMRGESPVRRAVAKHGRRAAFTTKDVRLWLQEQGREVAPSGRLPNELIEEYERAHAG